MVLGSAYGIHTARSVDIARVDAFVVEACHVVGTMGIHGALIARRGWWRQSGWKSSFGATDSRVSVIAGNTLAVRGVVDNLTVGIFATREEHIARIDAFLIETCLVVATLCVSTTLRTWRRDGRRFGRR